MNKERTGRSIKFCAVIVHGDKSVVVSFEGEKGQRNPKPVYIVFGSPCDFTRGLDECDEVVTMVASPPIASRGYARSNISRSGSLVECNAMIKSQKGPQAECREGGGPHRRSDFLQQEPVGLVGLFDRPRSLNVGGI